MKTIAEENQATDSVTLMQPNQDDEGNVKYENDLSNVKMDVRTEVGPSSQSKRSSVVRSLSQVMAMTQDPNTQQVLLGTILMNMQGDGMGGIRDYFRSQLVQLGAVKPTDEEKKELAAAQANQQPDPQSMFLIAEAKKSAALETKAKAETVKTLTAADLDRAKLAKTLLEIDHLFHEFRAEAVSKKHFAELVLKSGVWTTPMFLMYDKKFTSSSEYIQSLLKDGCLPSGAAQNILRAVGEGT
jgi:hypothetical protein